jgi:branched-chain amino acid transport system substrate-binding protein
VSSRFLQENGGIILGNDLVPTNSTDYSAYILKIRNAKPDFVYICLAGVDQTTFLKQYKEYGLSYPLAGGVMDTIPFWAAGIDSLSGHWQSLWYHGLTVPQSVAFTRKFTASSAIRPTTRAGDYVAAKMLTQAIVDTKSTDNAKLISTLKRRVVRHPQGAKGMFRKWDHQLLQEMCV